MKRVSLAHRVRYAFDNVVSRGPAGLVVWLALLTALLVAIASLIVLVAAADPDKGISEVLWDLLYQTLVPNPVDPKAGSPTFLGTMLFATLSSLLLVSVFIGIVTTAIDHRIQSLRKGRSAVIEHDHTLILGWSAQLFTIVSELMTARQHERHSCIVILADRDKVEMEDEIRAKMPRTGRTRVVCRTGNPLDPDDLEIVDPHGARSIIILAPEDVDQDTFVIKTMLALTHNPARKSQPYHIVADIHRPENLEIARMVGRSEVELVLVSEMVSRVLVQTCRQSGLSVVYTELLDFEGDELYFHAEPSLVGATFRETLTAYADCSVIGLCIDGVAVLNPPMETPIKEASRLIVIAEDSEAIKLRAHAAPEIDETAIRHGKTPLPAPERTLILGWNRHGPNIVNGLDNYVAAGSLVMVVANSADAEAEIARQCVGLKRLAVSFQRQDTTCRWVLDDLGIPSFQHIIVLSYSDDVGPQEADARVLITLLHLRDIRERSGRDFSIVSEMLDVRNRTLAEVTRADDFIVSDQLISLILTQISENKQLNGIYDELFGPDGSEIYLKPAEDFVCLGKPLNFYTAVEAARRRDEIALGYRLARLAHDHDQAYGVVVNPSKSETVTFQAGDKIIVLAAQQ